LSTAPIARAASTSYAAAGHYENLEGPFSQVGCGVYIANQRITLIQDFR